MDPRLFPELPQSLDIENAETNDQSRTCPAMYPFPVDIRGFYFVPTPDVAVPLPEKTQPVAESAPKKSTTLPIPTLAKNNKWIFADNFHSVPEGAQLERTTEGIFADKRKVIKQSILYFDTIKLPHLVFHDIKDLPVKGVKGQPRYVFQDDGQPVPANSTFVQIRLKTFEVNGRPIISWDGFISRTYQLTTTNRKLSKKEKREMTYDTKLKCFTWQGIPVEVIRKKIPKRYRAPEQPTVYVPPKIAPRNGPTLFAPVVQPVVQKGTTSEPPRKRRRHG